MGHATAWAPEDDEFVCKTPHLKTPAVAKRLGRSISAVAHRRAMLARTRGIDFGAGGGTKNPFSVGKRRLLAKTCTDCGLLLEGARFGVNQGRWRSKCVHCRAVDEAPRRKPYDPSDSTDRDRAAYYTQRLQALTLPTAVNHRKSWNDSDLSVLSNPDLTNFEKAVSLGRTYMAVASQCSDRGYPSKVGKGDPARGQWVIDNPNAPQAVSA